MEMNKCEVSIDKEHGPAKGQYFYRLKLFHYETNKYFNHLFFKYSHLKSFGKKVGLTSFVKQKYLKVSWGDHYYTMLDTSKDWREELDKWYKEENAKYANR